MNNISDSNISSQPRTILIATANHGKAEEIRKIFANSNYELRFLFDFPEEASEFSIQENAKSFEGNALIKALIFGERLQMVTLADDSGLCVDALNGRPGIYSARYSGLKNDQANYEKLLEDLKDVPVARRDAHYHCSVALYNPETKFVETVDGNWPGKIAFEPSGNKSFGYAPIFLPEEFNYKKTSAEFSHEELVDINHRGQAFRRALKILNKLF